MHSPDPHTVFILPPDTDLSLFSALLHQRGIAHRVSEQAGQLVLDVFDATQVAPVKQLYEGIARGDYQIQRLPLPQSGMPDAETPQIATWSRSWRQVQKIPVTSLLLLLSCIGFLLVEVDPAGRLYHWFTFQDFQSQIHNHQLVGRQYEAAVAAIGRGELWRLVTPAFLHFGWMHIVFNSLWLWELGRRVELRLGSLHLFFLVNSLAVGSNLVQYAANTQSVFGGMSGVIYGLLGYCWVWDKIFPSPQFLLPRGVAGMMVGMLIFFYTGITEMFGLHVANQAHMAGLILGLIFGVASALLSRLFSRTSGGKD
jgi:GlpG protein